MNHEKLFDEIVGKLNQLSLRAENQSSQDRKTRVQYSLQKSQEALRQSETELQKSLSSVDQLGFETLDWGREIKKLTDQLDQERSTNSKLASDLAKSLELNLKLQFEIEEVRAKINQSLNEEKKHNMYLSDRNRNMQTEMELSRAVMEETKAELSKARDMIQNLQNENRQMDAKLLQGNQLLSQIESDMESKIEEIQYLNKSLEEFESHTNAQNVVLKNLTEAAEKKMIELKVSLDKKAVECQDYYSHLQQSLAQTSILRQENLALKEHIAKLAQLQHQMNQSPTPPSPPAT